MNLVDLQRAAEQGRRGKLGTFPAGNVSNMRLDEALEWAAGALAKIQVCLAPKAIIPFRTANLSRTISKLCVPENVVHF